MVKLLNVILNIVNGLQISTDLKDNFPCIYGRTL